MKSTNYFTSRLNSTRTLAIYFTRPPTEFFANLKIIFIKCYGNLPIENSSQKAKFPAPIIWTADLKFCNDDCSWVKTK